MAQGNAYSALLARAQTWTGRQTFDLEQGLKEITTPAGNPPAGYRFVYLKADGKLYQKNSSGTESEFAGGAGAATHAALPDLSGDAHPDHLYANGRAAAQAHWIGSTLPGGRAMIDGSSDPGNPGDVLIAGVILADRTNGVVGIGEPDPVPGLGALQVPSLRINNALDPGNLGLRFAVVSQEGHGTEAAGVVLLFNETTSETLALPCFRRAGVAPPVTGQFQFDASWDLAGVTSGPEDTFDRTGSTLGTSSSGHLWTEHTGNWSTTGEYARMDTAPVLMSLATMAGQQNAGTVEVTMAIMNHASFPSIGLCLRRGSDNSCYLLLAQPGSNRYRFIRYTGTAYDTGVLFDLAKDPQDGDVVRVQMAADQFIVTIQAAGAGSFVQWMNQSALGQNTSSVQHGLAGSWDGGELDTRWNNFKGANG